MYIDGFICPVKAADRERYIAFARATAAIFKDRGAIRVVEGWADDVPDGVHTSFPMAVKLEPGEVVMFSWVEWPDKATRDACFSEGDTDGRMAALGPMPFDGKRLVYGGFIPVLDIRS